MTFESSPTATKIGATFERQRIAVLLPNMEGGGAERVALTLIEEFVARGFTVDLLLLEARGDFLSLVPPSVRIVDLHAPRMRHAMKPLIAYLRRRRPAAMQVSMWPLTIVGILAARLALVSTRVVVSEHTTLSRKYLGRGIRQAIRLSVRALYPLAHARVVVSQNAADDLAGLTGLPRSSLEVIYNPIPKPPKFNSTVSSPAVEWPDRAVRILTVGNLKDAKNHALLLRAFAELHKRRDAFLVILGEGALRMSLERLAEQLGIADRLAIPGFVMDPAPFYATADLFVLSSDYEGFGNVLVEAMHHGVPIVSTDCDAGPREILADGRFGRLVPVGDATALSDAMDRALSSPRDAAALRARAAVFEGQDSLNAYLTLLLGPRHSGAAQAGLAWPTPLRATPVAPPGH